VIKAKTVGIQDKGERTATPGIQVEGLALVGLRVPSGFHYCQIAIQASVDNSDWQEIVSPGQGVPLAGFQARERMLFVLPAELTAPWPYIRIACSFPQPAGLTFALRLAEL
jgi:hypothetical protein